MIDTETTDHSLMPSWKCVWRRGFAPLLSTRSLEALAAALEADDQRLRQGTTSGPTVITQTREGAVLGHLPPEYACAIGWCGWQGEGLETVPEVEEFFARMCFEVDQRLGQGGACRWFINWFDETPRHTMRRELLAEIRHNLAEREAKREAAERAATKLLGPRPDGNTGKLMFAGF